MSIMREESFGPVVGIIPVDGDEQALSLMNDSELGLTASIWTADSQRAEALGQQLDTGTVFMIAATTSARRWYGPGSSKPVAVPACRYWVTSS